MVATDTVERVARVAYGRLVAILAARSHDIMAAEDALQEAFLSALAQWPGQGTPANPEAWLLTVARRRLTDATRLNARSQGRMPELVATLGEVGEALPDDRLELMMLCAHPAIDEAIRAPLILQTVLGLNAERIAAAFLVAPATMGQRLVRAKQKMRDTGMRFELPATELLEPRMQALLDAIYAAYGAGWEDIGALDEGRALDEEALLLAQAIHQRLPDHAETLGLLALMHYTRARKMSRRDAQGRFVPLDQQEVVHWDRDDLRHAEALLRRAAAHGRPGRYQLEAAIQSAHFTARLTGRKDPAAVLQLYTALVQLAPSAGASVAHASALAEVHGPQAGLDQLDMLQESVFRAYQPWHALRADLLRRCGRVTEARNHYQQAIGLTQDAAVRSFLLHRMDGMASASDTAS